MLCWKLGDPRSGVALLADVVDAVLIVVVHRLAVPLGQAFGGLVTRKLSDSARFLTWCITPEEKGRKRDSRICWNTSKGSMSTMHTLGKLGHLRNACFLSSNHIYIHVL